MKIFRTLGFCFLFIMVPLGGLLAAYPNEIANAVSSIAGTTVSRGALGIAFLFIAAVCMRVDIGIRRRHAEM
ncbi:hypothetical protein [Pseudomonas sp. OIL-1]|uniref:hypothetical protein n=1 Tax=Pseudomonas sp. OIL-1 TaxID=2706126 RepID=UPI0013A77EFC|nr:hypothetical protein [Pseudomonas sp. OIL-1]QIB51740.1 hypothetical protein G3M63_12190 [Pseudomonas sp. OIL-1]